VFCLFYSSFVDVHLSGQRMSLVWFSSRVPFVREEGLSSTMAYLDGRIMVLVELLTGSSTKTRVPFAGSQQYQLVIDLINPSEYLIYLHGRSIP
jgi:hypothetical protein